MGRPIRVLHLIDWLGGGGSEQLIWEIVRLSDPARSIHRVATVHPHAQNYVFAERFARFGAYDLPPASARDEGGAPIPATPASARGLAARSIEVVRLLHRISAPVLHQLPVRWKQPIWDAEEIVTAMPRLLVECARHSPDVIHSHGLSGFRVGLALHYLTRKPYLHTVTALFTQLERIGWKRLIDEYRRFHASVSRWFIAEPYVPDLLGVGVQRSRIGALRGVIDLRSIAEVRDERERHRREIRRELGVPDDALLALSVGRFDPVKGHEYAVRALPHVAAEFPNLHWAALGQGPSEGYEASARALGVADRAHLVGFRDDPLPYYAAADLYLRTPIVEADTLASYTAMAFGLPIVGFDTRCPTELIPTVGHGLLARNEDPIALANAIRDLLRLRDRGRALGARGIDYAARHLDIGTSIEEFVGSYERAIGRSSQHLDESPSA